jgi:hypothetical protein
LKSCPDTLQSLLMYPVFKVKLEMPDVGIPRTGMPVSELQTTPESGILRHCVFLPEAGAGSFSNIGILICPYVSWGEALPAADPANADVNSVLAGMRASAEAEPMPSFPKLDAKARYVKFVGVRESLGWADIIRKLACPPTGESAQSTMSTGVKT